jgi:hypothetical protein
MRTSLGGRDEPTFETGIPKVTISLQQDGAASATLLIVGSAVVLLLVYLCLRDGVVPNQGWKVERATRPLLYWLLIALFVLLSGVLFWGGVSLASERF